MAAAAAANQEERDGGGRQLQQLPQTRSHNLTHTRRGSDPSSGNSVDQDHPEKMHAALHHEKEEEEAMF